MTAAACISTSSDRSPASRLTTPCRGEGRRAPAQIQHQHRGQHLRQHRHQRRLQRRGQRRPRHHRCKSQRSRQRRQPVQRALPMRTALQQRQRFGARIGSSARATGSSRCRYCSSGPCSYRHLVLGWGWVYGSTVGAGVRAQAPAIMMWRRHCGGRERVLLKCDHLRVRSHSTPRQRVTQRAGAKQLGRVDHYSNGRVQNAETLTSCSFEMLVKSPSHLRIKLYIPAGHACARRSASSKTFYM